MIAGTKVESVIVIEKFHETQIAFSEINDIAANMGLIVENKL
jgi:hypothetical protein